jgi:hypothetical protein
MKRRHQLENRNFLLRNSSKSSRDPENQVFDHYDHVNDFTNRKIILQYRMLGESVMKQNIS